MDRMGKLIGVAVLLVALGGCAAGESPDAAYLAAVEDSWEGPAQPTDAEYVAAAHEACGQYGDGIARDAVKVVESLNYDSEVNNILIVRAAIRAYCPD